MNAVGTWNITQMEKQNNSLSLQERHIVILSFLLTSQVIFAISSQAQKGFWNINEVNVCVSRLEHWEGNGMAFN